MKFDICSDSLSLAMILNEKDPSMQNEQNAMFFVI